MCAIVVERLGSAGKCPVPKWSVWVWKLGRGKTCIQFASEMSVCTSACQDTLTIYQFAQAGFSEPQLHLKYDYRINQLSTYKLNRKHLQKV